jgi:hypothetical protein
MTFLQGKLIAAENKDAPFLAKTTGRIACNWVIIKKKKMIGRTGEETQQRWLLIAVIVCTTPRMRVGTLELGRAKSYQQLTATRLCLGSQY